MSDYITGQRVTWEFDVTLSESAGKPVIKGEALHLGSFQGVGVPVDITQEILERSAESFIGVDLMAGHPEPGNPGDPTLVFGTVHKAYVQNSALIIEGTPDDTELGRQQATGIRKKRLQLSIGAKPVFNASKLWKVQGDHIATIRKNHTADPDTKVQIGIAMSKISEELVQLAVWNQAYQNDLPDSAFLWIDPRYKSGESDNKALRKLPVYDKDGSLDRTHVTAAMQAVLGARGGVKIPPEDRKKVYNKLVKLYKELDLDPPDFHLESGDDDLLHLADNEGQGGIDMEKEELVKLQKLAEDQQEKMDKQEAQIAQLMEESKGNAITLAKEKKADLIQLAAKNGLQDRTKELKEIDHKEVELSVLADLEIVMLKEVNEKLAKEAEEGKQKQIALGGNDAGAGGKPEDAALTQLQTEQKGRDALYSFLSGQGQQVKLVKVPDKDGDA